MVSTWIGLAALALVGYASGGANAALQAVEGPSSPARAPALVFDGVTVVNVEQGKLVPDQRVVTAGRRIQAIGGVQAIALPRDAKVIDARGKYLIPGLWDMHVHTWDYPEIFYPLAIANGVTGVREMWHADIGTLIGWRHEIALGERVGPRTVVTGVFLGDQNAGTPGEAVALIRELKAAGADFIKIREGLSRETYFAALAEARRLGIPLVGHFAVPGIALAEGADSGQRTFEHVQKCPDEAATPEECAALAAHLRSRGAWLTPTVILNRYLFGGPAPERLRFWPDNPDVGLPLAVGGGQSTEERQAKENKTTAALATLVRAGMPLLAGTDAASFAPENLPGFSLHEELAWFVKAGMTPAAALQTATINSAVALNATDSLGTVAPGKMADLVVLTANPLADITNIDKIDAVVADGRYFDRTQLDALIADVERQGRRGQGAPTP